MVPATWEGTAELSELATLRIMTEYTDTNDALGQVLTVFPDQDGDGISEILAHDRYATEETGSGTITGMTYLFLSSSWVE